MSGPLRRLIASFLINLAELIAPELRDEQRVALMLMERQWAYERYVEEVASRQ